ncbi:hypothetical protein SHELI_v1c11470 [Spiroplasma helicoides]|uniref:Lipoprotein n=1 Tax=Spiroplasma helicoides TaxID=216938 RepID=A0A1B3SMD5_9MOLU|nr:hypothetical protein [Spiroplasma helicoides]AOG61094.1 hypothetical protein SHELI_v1c11470 [Spiroplasma helicoides]
MKKLIYFLASLTFTSQSLFSVISCSCSTTKNEDEVEQNGLYDPKAPDFSIDPSLTDMQNQMKTGAEMISRMIIASRHENLNFNVNEILSSYLSPYSSEMNMPTSYTYNGRNVNLSELISRYKNLLAPQIEKINLGNFAGVYSSYVMGMYDDGFYQKFVDKGYFEDGFNENGDTGFNKYLFNSYDFNEVGLLMGLDKNLNLSDDENRRNLAWGIQDNGALSNYLLEKGFDGGYPGGSNGTSTPYIPAPRDGSIGGTNGAGYLFYNSVLASGKSKLNDFKEFNKSIKDKIKGASYDSADLVNGDYSSTIDGVSFNQTGSLMAMTAGALNLKGYINKFVALRENIAESDFGAESLLTFANFLTPMLSKMSTYTDLVIQGAVSSLLYNAQAAINQIQNDESGKDIKKFLLSNGFSEKTLTDKINIRESIAVNDLMNPSPENVSIGNLYKTKDNDLVNDSLTNLSRVAQFLKELSELHSKLSPELKNEFLNKVLKTSDTPFGKSYQLIINPKVTGLLDLGGLTQEGWEECMGNDGTKGANLLSLLSKAYAGLAKKEVKDIVEKTILNYKDRVLTDLNRSQKNTLLEALGYDFAEKKYKEDSFLKGYYDLLTDKSVSGVDELNNLFVDLKKGINESIAPVHERATQYINNKEYWNTRDIKMGATSPTEVNGTIEFTLEYKGAGDSDSNADQQTKKVEVPKNFNPYQTIVENQKDFANTEKLKSKIDTSKVSGVVLGKEQLNMSEEDIMKYDGLGENYKDVKHQYKVVWKNVSNDVENPYWVIVDLKSFNQDGEQFYNIY